MSSTKNTKDNRHVVRVTYLTESIFKIPDGLDLSDKSIVKEWFVKWDELHIRYVDGRKENFSPYSAASECENKDGDTELINADDIGCLHVYEEEDEEKENDDDDDEEDDDEEDEEPRCKKHDLYMREDNETKCSKCCEELGEEYSGKYCGDIYGCGYTGLSEQCKLCVKCNPKLWWLERRPTKLPRKVKEFEDKNE